MYNLQRKRKKEAEATRDKKNTLSHTHWLCSQLFLGARLNLKHTHKRRCWSALYAISTRQYAIKCTVHTTYAHRVYVVCMHWHQWRNKHVKHSCVRAVYAMCAFHKRKSSAVCCFYFRFILSCSSFSTPLTDTMNDDDSKYFVRFECPFDLEICDK